MSEVVTVGECLVALVGAAPGPLAETSTFERHVAGAEANVAVGLARLGRSVAFVGRVGADGFGLAIRRRLRGEGVDVSHLAEDASAATGLLVRERRAVGPAEVVYHRSGSAGSRLGPADVAAAGALIDGARWLHLSGVTPALSVSARAAVEAAIERAAGHGLAISLDLNVRRRLWTEAEAAEVLGALVGRCEVVLGSAEEVALVAGVPPDAEPEVAARALLDRGPATVVVTVGAAGSLSVERDGTVVRRPALPVARVVDPVGAGDAFGAGWIAARLAGRDAGEALAWGNAAGASVVATVGDMAGLPTMAELERLLRPGMEDTVR